MRFFGYAVASMFVAAMGSAEAAPLWPNQGVMKVSATHTPSVVKWTMDDCFKVVVDKEESRLRILDYQNESRAVLQSTFPRTLKTNGSLIILAMRQEGAVNFVVTAEGEDGSLETVTAATFGPACPLSKLSLTGNDPLAFDTVIIQNTDEIQQVLQRTEL